MHTSHYSIFLLVYVDDIILTGSPQAPLHALLKSLQGEFAIKDLGPLHYFLGMEVHNTSTGLLLNQAKFTQEILQRSKMTEARAAPTPCTTDEPLSIHTGDPMPDPALYRSIVGALQYLTLTRPDIAYSVNTACQFLHSPTTMHWQAVKRIMRYLADTPQHGLLFTRTSSTALHAFSDASWAGDRDDRRSVGGFCIYLGPNLISWSSRKQRTVARSSTEAEYKSLADTTAELIWIEFLLRDLKAFPPHPPTLWCDNLSAIYLTANPVFHARTKHVEIDFHFIRERLARQQLSVHYISSIDQPADIFTKGLSSARFRMLRSKLTVHSALSACGGMLTESQTKAPSQKES